MRACRSNVHSTMRSGVSMISAKQAREKTDIKRVANFKAEIEKLIKHSIDKGRDEAKISGMVPDEIIKELKETGYIVESQSGLIKISW